MKVEVVKKISNSKKFLNTQDQKLNDRTYSQCRMFPALLGHDHVSLPCIFDSEHMTKMCFN